MNHSRSSTISSPTIFLKNRNNQISKEENETINETKSIGYYDSGIKVFIVESKEEIVMFNT